MKTLEELKSMINEVIGNYKIKSKEELTEIFDEWTEEEIDEEYEKQLENLEEMKKYNFLSYDLIDNVARLHNDYADAKRYVEKGGQVLVIDKEKVYTYKVKNDEEYSEYLRKEIQKENLRKINYYGL